MKRKKTIFDRVVAAPLMFCYSLALKVDFLNIFDTIEKVVDTVNIRTLSLFGHSNSHIVYKRGTFVVTGCSQKAGKLISIDLLQRGFNVVSTFDTIKDSQDFKLTLTSSEQALFIPFELDIQNQTSINKTCLFINHLKKPLIGVIITENTELKQPIELSNINIWTDNFTSNLFGPMIIISNLLPLLRETKGRIIVVGDVCGLAASPMKGVYASSKRAMESAMDTLRNELYQFNISVSLIINGSVDYHSSKSVLSEEDILYAPMIKTAKVMDREVYKNRTDLKIVLKSVDDALFSVNPKSKYLVGLDAKVTRIFRWLLSDRVFDWGYQVLVKENQ